MQLAGEVHTVKAEPELVNIIKQVLVPMFYKESQLGRSMRGTSPSVRKEFKRNLMDSILRLVSKADNGTLSNGKIREEIKHLAEDDNISVGQAQKVINVYMKYYCILTGKLDLVRELDCPIDSGIVKEIWETLSDQDRQYLESYYNLQQEDISLKPFFIYNPIKEYGLHYLRILTGTVRTEREWR